MFYDELREPLTPLLNFDRNPLYFIKAYQMETPRVIPTHFHSWLELVFYQEGAGGELTLDGEKHRFTRQDLVIIKPYGLHQFSTFGPLKFCVWGIDINAFCSLFTNAPIAQRIGWFVDQLYHCPPVQPPPTPGAWSLFNPPQAESWLAVLGALFQLEPVFGQASVPTPPADEALKFIGILSYLEAHAAEKITLEAVAKRFGMSKSSFSRRFKARFEIGFTEFLNRIRIKNAEFLLHHSSKTVAEIAYDVGFQDVSYFIKVFQRINHRSPSTFRKTAGPVTLLHSSAT